MLKAAVNWANLRHPIKRSGRPGCRSPMHETIRPPAVSLSSATGTKTKTAPFEKVFSEHFASASMAIGWSYPEADIDYVASASIINSLIKQLTPMLLEDAKAQTAVLGRALLTQARIAGLSPRFASLEPMASFAVCSLHCRPLKAKLSRRTGINCARRLSVSSMAEVRATSCSLRCSIGSQAFKDRATRHSPSTPFACLRHWAPTPLPTGPVPEGLPDDVRAFIPTISDTRIWTRLQPVITKLRTFRNQNHRLNRREARQDRIRERTARDHSAASEDRNMAQRRRR